MNVLKIQFLSISKAFIDTFDSQNPEPVLGVLLLQNMLSGTRFPLISGLVVLNFCGLLNLKTPKESFSCLETGLFQFLIPVPISIPFHECVLAWGKNSLLFEWSESNWLSCSSFFLFIFQNDNKTWTEKGKTWTRNYSCMLRMFIVLHVYVGLSTFLLFIVELCCFVC